LVERRASNRKGCETLVRLPLR